MKMSLNIRPILFFLLTSPLLVQCVPTGQDITTLDLRVRNLDNRMLNIENRSEGNPIEQIMKKQAEMSNTIDRLNMDFLQIKGRLDESSHFYQNSKEENTAFQKEINLKLNDLSEQIMLLADQMNQASTSLATAQKNSQEAIARSQEAEERARLIAEESARSIAAAEKKAAMALEEAAKKSKTPEIEPSQTKLKYSDGKKQEPPAKADKPDTADTPTKSASAEEAGIEIYDRALSLFRASKFNEAYRAFTEYIEQYPKGKMAPNTRFWLGDCYYNQQEYELAILEYQKVLADFPKTAKAPAALLKQGLAFEKLKDGDTAKIVYKKLIEEYPNSEQVSTAKKRIDQL